MKFHPVAAIFPMMPEAEFRELKDDILKTGLIEPIWTYHPVPRTGSVRSNATGDDGDLLKGIVWPVPRFTDNEDGTVADNLTGLIWLKDANCFEPKPWPEAVDLCNNLTSGQCGLTDGSEIGDWRMSNIKELLSLISYRFYNPPPTQYCRNGQVG